MKHLVFSAAVMIFCMCAAADENIPNFSKLQSELRGHYRKSLKKYKQLRSELSEQFAEQIKSADENFRVKEFQRAAELVQALEGDIKVQKSSAGKSRVWEKRSRVDNYEVRSEAKNYLTGPEKEVIVWNGELLQKAADMTLPTRGGLGFSFQRIYFSNTTYSGPLGNGWDFNYNTRLFFNNADLSAATRATLLAGGIEHKFFKKNGVWESAVGNYYCLKQEGEALYVYDSLLFRMEFEVSVEKKNAYRLKALASRHGSYLQNRINLRYQDKSDRLSQITEPYGNKIAIVYDSNGRICQMASKHRAVYYSYDSSGNLIEVRTSPIAVSFQKKNAMQVRYRYKKFGGRYLLCERIENDSSAPCQVNYDARGRVTAVGKLTQTVDGRWRIKYSGKTVTVSPAAPSAPAVYEFAGKKHKDLPDSVSVPSLKNRSSFVYSSSGQVVKSTDALGIVRNFTYDEKAVLPYLRKNLLQTVKIPRSSRGEKIVQKISYFPQTAFCKNVQLLEYSTGNEARSLSTRSYKYSKDWEVAETNDNGIITWYFYNRFGQLALRMDANNRATINYYAEDWPETNEQYAAIGSGDPNGAGLLVKTIEDASLADLLKVQAALKLRKKFYFNEILRVQPVALTSYFSYDALGNVTYRKKGDTVNLTLYNRAGGILTSLVSGSGVKVTEWTDDFKKAAVMHQFTPTGINSFDGQSHEYFEGRFYKESFFYDQFGLIERHIKTDEPIDGKVSAFTYYRFPNGAVKKIVNPAGVARIDEYGPHGLLHRQVLKGVTNEVVISDKLEYFPDGQIKSFQDAQGDNTIYELDGYGRCVTTKTANGNISTTKLDGLGRPVATIVKNNGRTIAQREYIYNKKGMLSTQYDYFISSKENRRIETQRFKYDPAGNITAQKSVLKNGWFVYLLDGLNRKVATAMPEGDVSVAIYSFDKLAMPVQLNIDSEKKYRPQGVIYVLNAASQPCAVLQISSDWETALGRGEIFEYSADGKVISILNPTQTRHRKYYNSIGLLVREETIPLKTTLGEKNILTDYEHTVSGILKTQILQNKALAVMGSKDDAEVKLISVPQKIIYGYDDLERESFIQQPDGLVIQKKYDSNSRIKEVLWYHAAEPQKILKHLRFSYGVMGQLRSITDGLSGKMQRHYTYDKYGNCVVAKDLSATPVISTIREFDSMGQNISESTHYGNIKLPGFTMKRDLQSGSETLQWSELNGGSHENWFSQTTFRDALGRVKQLSLDKSETEVISWKYIGAFPSEKEFPKSHITTHYLYSPWNELIQTEFIENSKQFGKLQYKYDPVGNMLFSSTELAVGSLKKFSFAQFMEYNSFRQLVAQNGENTIPDTYQIKKRWQQVLYDKDSFQAAKTQRNVFDQADNIWAIYNGHKINNPEPQRFDKNNLFMFLSPAQIIPQSGNISEESLLELASNRNAVEVEYTGRGKLKAKENVYDHLGNLREFSGHFWNGERSMAVRWKLDFDTMGRLISMRGTSEKDSAFVKKGALAAELFFAYDAENRRIRKVVKDYARYVPSEREEFTIYTGNRQAIVLYGAASDFRIKEQYLWNADSMELLMAVLPEYWAENNYKAENECYYFQQDRGYNTVCVTKSPRERVELVAGTSYLDFGKNATSAQIIDIDSSMSEVDNKCAALNKKLDDGELASWQNLTDKPQFMEIKLSGENSLSFLKIWSDGTFPASFLVFVLPEEAPSPQSSEDLCNWIRQEDQKKYFVYKAENISSEIPQKAITVPLCNMNGNRIVLVWDKHNANQIGVREFEVTSVPGNPGAIAFAGQWLDRETNMYYQINRYKIAGSNKFISPDPIGFLEGSNLYAYAKNNPLEWHDPDGQVPILVVLGGAAAGGLINSSAYVIKSLIDGKKISARELAIRAGTGAVAGGVAVATFGAGTAFGFSGVTGTIVSGAVSGGLAGAASGGFDAGIRSHITGNNIRGTLNSTLKGAASGGAIGTVFGGAAAGFFHAFNAKPVQDIITRGFGTGLAITQRSVKGIFNSGSTYQRPAGYRQGVRDQVWDNAIEKSTGQVRDPLSGRFMSKGKPWDMGHKPGYEWRKFERYSRENNLSRQDVLDWNNNPNHFRPELPSSNRSHAGENLTSEFFGGTRTGNPMSAPMNATYGF